MFSASFKIMPPPFLLLVTYCICPRRLPVRPSVCIILLNLYLANRSPVLDETLQDWSEHHLVVSTLFGLFLLSFDFFVFLCPLVDMIGGI